METCCVHRLEDSKILILPRFKVIITKGTARHFVDIDKIILKCIWKGKITRSFCKLKKKEEQGLHLANYKIYYISTVIKTV